MEQKIYCVTVTTTTASRAYVRATSAEEATEKAEQLLDQTSLEYEWGQDELNTSLLTDETEVVTDAEYVKIADTNEENYKELGQ